MGPLIVGSGNDVLSKSFEVLGLDVPRWVAALIVAVPFLWKWRPIVESVIRRVRSVYSRLKGLPTNPEELRRVKRRRRIAKHLLRRIQTIDVSEQWDDYRFTELEAQVEVRERGSATNPLRRLFARGGRSRERSLTNALAKSPSSLIQLEGDPGAGKSVALRHLARRLGEKCEKSKSSRTPIPIYFNLKRLARKGRSVDARLIEDFVNEGLREGATITTDQDFGDEWKPGVEDGTWLFLFDSFDEIPEVLSSTEYDAAVADYSNAIADFLANTGDCRGVIASREFKSPEGQGWPKFSIVPLSEKRRRRLVRRASTRRTQRLIMSRLPSADEGVVSQSSNPLFLSLLCAYVRESETSPDTSHVVYERYVSTGFDREESRLAEKFGVAPVQLRDRSEEFGFCMAAFHGLGLEPQRQDLLQAMDDLGFPTGNEAENALDALIWIKLGVTPDPSSGHSPTFKFVHRRFAEYFATCLVDRDPKRIPPTTLLTDGSWRETAVTLLQTQRGALERLGPAAAALLHAAADEVPEAGSDLCEDVRNSMAVQSTPQSFSWPEGSRHLLDLLQSGLPGRVEELPERVRDDAGRLLAGAYAHGQVFDKKWSLEVASVAPDPLFTELVRSAFRSQLEWLKEAAYEQVARLRSVPDDIVAEIRLTLLGMLARGTLRRGKQIAPAELPRLSPPRPLPTLARASALPVIDLGLHVAAAALLVSAPGAAAVVPIAALVVSSAALPALAASVAMLGGSRSESAGAGTAPRYRPLMTASWSGLQLRFFSSILVLSGALAAGIMELAALVYALTWAPSALVAAGLGRGTRAPLWPIMPLVPVPELWRRLAEAKAWKYAPYLLVSLAAVAVFGGLGAGVTWVAFSGPMVARVIVIAVFGSLMLYGIVTGLYGFATTSLVDWRWYLRWWRGQPADM